VGDGASPSQNKALTIDPQPVSMRICFLSLSTLLVLTSVGELLAAAAELASRPNIVVFISDDHGVGDSSVGSASDFSTPSLERLAHDGMTFTCAFAASPSCAPSRAALLTGLMPARNGSMLNHQAPLEAIKKLPAYLHELGYEVVAFGKVAHYKQGQQYGFDQASHDSFHDDTCVAAAVDWLRLRHNKKPLCLIVGTNWPHVPWPKAKTGDGGKGYKLPPTFVDTPETRQWRARYATAVTRMDRDLGLMFSTAYERLGKNTLFIHFSDHGAQWPFGKWNLYDAGTRVPFFAVWPGVIRAGSRSDELVSLVDVLPTIIDAAGGKVPGDIDGISLVNLLRGQPMKVRDRVFATHSGDGQMNTYPMRSVRTAGWKYIRNLRSNYRFMSHIDKANDVDGRGYWRSWVAKSQTDDDAAAIVDRYRHRPAEELYDLKGDPFEQRNLAGDARYAKQLAELRNSLDEWMHRQSDKGLPTEAAAAERMKEFTANVDAK